MAEAPDVADENTVTLDEVLEEELQLESDANAVLGPSDDKNCSYDKGYVPRQALYSCRSCMKDKSFSAGVCLACSYHCHEGHDLIELYTKRYFRCDCGNKKFGGMKCNLTPTKVDENEANGYNQNFQGLYCVCSRPYPDPEDEVADDMIQCSVCEDWYHNRHLNSEGPGELNYAEMICESCTKRLDFLEYYSGLLLTKVEKPKGPEENTTVDVELKTDEPNETPDASTAVSNAEKMPVVKPTEAKIEETDSKAASEKENNCTAESVPPDANPSEVIGCKIKTGKRTPIRPGASFWPPNFRSSLCACADCKEMYSKLKVPWIIDFGDTVSAYEEKGKTTGENGAKASYYEQGMKALSELNRVQQMEAILNYNELKANLSTYLAKFAENKKVVREEDIHEFFSQLNARKRQKLGDGTPPYVCH